MQPHLDNAHSLVNAGVILTPNNRLAQYLRESLCNFLQATNKPLADSEQALLAQTIPAVLPWQSWAADLAVKAMLAGYMQPCRILSAVEESIIWQRIIELGGEGHLLAPALAAAEAQRAQQLLQEWCVDPKEHVFEFNSVTDCAVYYGWREAFLTQLEQRQYMTGGQAIAALAQLDDAQLRILYHLHSPCDKAPQLHGFHSVTPLQQQLLARIQSALQLPAQPHIIKGLAGQPLTGSDKEKAPRQTEWHIAGHSAGHSAGQSAKSVTARAYDDFAGEMRAAAHWASQAASKAPAEQIAIVVPTLAQQKYIVERIMREVFYKPQINGQEPQAGTAPDAQKAADRYNISAGRPLASLPLVDVFLQLAKSALLPIPLAAWQQLLWSPFIFTGHELPGGRNRLMQAMYLSGEQEFTLADLPRLLAWYTEKHAKHPLPTLGAQFDDVSLIAGMRAEPGSLLARLHNNKPALPSQWLDHFSALAQQFNWPGGRSLNSDEFQQRQTFAESCADFWQVDALVGKVSATEALALLRQQLQDTIYHKQTRTQAGQPIVQVLGALEASGQQFDQLWLCGMSEREWPPRPTINALLPFALQARLEMPGASEQREFAYAQRLTDSLITASAQLQLSYVHLSDGVETALAPIVDARLQAAGRELKCMAQTQVAAKTQPCITTQPWETLPDFYGSEYPQLNDAQQRPVLRRGISLLQDYAHNPFIAYARHRLEIEPLPRRESGLTALERGQVLHTVVETCWRNLQSSSALQSIPAPELEQLLASSVRSALQQLNRRRFKPLGARLLELQQQVFTRLLQAWLELERERPGFSVAALEQPLALQLGGFYISGRVDRIDRLDSGELLLLDYKTGGVATTGWLDERISSPQLPLYWLALQQPLSGQPAVELQDTAQTDLYEAASQCAPALAFACLKSGELGFKGLADEDTAAAEIDGIDSMRTAQRDVFTNNRLLQQHWQQGLAQRCREIASGLAVLDLDSPTVSSFGDDAYEPLTRARAALVAGLYEVVETPQSNVGERDD